MNFTSTPNIQHIAYKGNTYTSHEEWRVMSYPRHLRAPFYPRQLAEPFSANTTWKSVFKAIAPHNCLVLPHLDDEERVQKHIALVLDRQWSRVALRGPRNQPTGRHIDFQFADYIANARRKTAKFIADGARRRNDVIQRFLTRRVAPRCTAQHVNPPQWPAM